MPNSRKQRKKAAWSGWLAAVNSTSNGPPLSGVEDNELRHIVRKFYKAGLAAVKKHHRMIRCYEDVRDEEGAGNR